MQCDRQQNTRPHFQVVTPQRKEEREREESSRESERVRERHTHGRHPPIHRPQPLQARVSLVESKKKRRLCVRCGSQEGVQKQTVVFPQPKRFFCFAVSLFRFFSSGAAVLSLTSPPFTLTPQHFSGIRSSVKYTCIMADTKDDVRPVDESRTEVRDQLLEIQAKVSAEWAETRPWEMDAPASDAEAPAEGLIESVGGVRARTIRACDQQLL
jgi:hypothetical protein